MLFLNSFRFCSVACLLFVTLSDLMPICPANALCIPRAPPKSYVVFTTMKKRHRSNMNARLRCVVLLNRQKLCCFLSSSIVVHAQPSPWRLHITAFIYNRRIGKGKIALSMKHCAVCCDCCYCGNVVITKPRLVLLPKLGKMAGSNFQAP
ncbi:unnamed protein product [Clavelina lepadiformis]|uniref:Secreted protein n=1 Tax=Clavelina lepadiformis TaxID=159417 RepID=A0ABP0GN84_CLALP